MKHIILPDNRQRSLAFYLAMEEFVASNVEGEAFFVWQSEPTVIYGRNQVLENEVNMEYCRDHEVEVVRRKSGGGCVYSDKGNIMISYVSERGMINEVFDRYLDALTGFLQSIGVPAVKSGRNDVLVNGRKVSGNAFRCPIIPNSTGFGYTWQTMDAVFVEAEAFSAGIITVDLPANAIGKNLVVVKSSENIVVSDGVVANDTMTLVATGAGSITIKIQ